MRLRRGLVGIALAAGIPAISTAALPGPAMAAQSPSVLVGAVPTLPRGAIETGVLSTDTRLSVDVVLKPRSVAAMTAYATAVATSGSGQYRHYLTPAEFRDRFAPTGASLIAVRRELQSAGLHPGSISANGLSLRVSATAGALSRGLHTRLQTYRLASGRAAFANTSRPFLGQAAPYVEGVIGLDNLTTFKASGALTVHNATRTSAALVQELPTGGPQPCAAASSLGSGPPYTADQLATAYDLSPLYQSGDEGAGQTVALFELYGYLPSDIAAYQACFGTSTSVKSILVDGGSPPALEGQLVEPDLDIEGVIGLAPKANILVYEGPNSVMGFYDTESAIVSQDVSSVISTSYAGCEQNSGSSFVASLDLLFEEAAIQGQSEVASAGDTGSEGCDPSNTSLAVDSPASDPFVTGVAGTTMTAIGPPPTEVSWFGGGGISSDFTMPTYQSNAPLSLNVKNAYSSGTPCAAAAGDCREVPDVAADADSNSGYVIYVNGSWASIGGTSAAAPVWASLLALTNASSACGGNHVGFVNPSLYVIAGSSSYSSDFNDVTSGNNDYTGTNGGKYGATSGYDMATGLGTPIGAPLAASLCQSFAPTAYTTNYSAGTVTPINTSTHVAGAPITVGSEPYAVAITPNGATAYVANLGSGTVTPISTATNSAGTPIAVGTQPYAVAITPSGTTAYVTNLGDGTVTPISTATNTAGTPIVVGSQPSSIAISPDGATAYVTNHGSGTVSVIAVATNTVEATIPVGGDPYGIAITPDGRTALVVETSSHEIIAITTATDAVSAPILTPPGSVPAAIAVSPDGTTAYVAEYGNGTVVPLSLATDSLGTPIVVGGTNSEPNTIAFNSTGTEADVVLSSNGTVVPIDTASGSVGTPIVVGARPIGMAITPDQAPVAHLAVHSGRRGEPTLFDASGSFVARGRVLSYAWSFGDGTSTITSTPTVSHVYSIAGPFTASVVETSSGDTSTSLVFTGQTATRDGGPSAVASATVALPTPTIYVANGGAGLSGGTDTVTPVNVSSGVPGPQIPVGNATACHNGPCIPSGIAISPDGLTVYVIEGSVVVPIDTATNQPQEGMQVNGGVGIAISPDGSTAYVSSTNGDITPIALATDTPGPAIVAGTSAYGIAITPNGSTAYVTNPGSNTVTPINLATSTVGPPIPVGVRPEGIAVTPNGATAYVANLGSNSVTPISVATNTPGAPIAVGTNPAGIAIAPNGSTAYVANYSSASVTPINLTTGAAGSAIPVGTNPIDVAVTPDGAMAFVSNNGDGTITPISTASNTPGTPISVGAAAAWGIAVTPDQAPKATVTAQPEPAGLPTMLDASGSTSAYGVVASYSWNFGDGSTSVTSTASTSHVYVTAGPHTVSVTETTSSGTSTGQVFTGQTMSNDGAPSATATKGFIVPPALRPGAPTIGQVTSGNASVTVAFAAPTSSGTAPITSYKVLESSGGAYGTATTNPSSCTQSPCVVTGLTNGTTYTFKVEATNSGGTGPASSPSLAVTPATVPGAPTLKSATPRNRLIKVVWSAPSSSGGASITGYVATAKNGSTVKTCKSSRTSCTIYGLKNGKRYTISVVAKNAVGTSESSNTKSATPKIPHAATVKGGAIYSLWWVIKWGARSRLVP